MQIDERLIPLIPQYALLGVLDLRVMMWCMQHELTPGAIITAAAKGVRSLTEMARKPENYDYFDDDHSDETLVSLIDPLRLADTSPLVLHGYDPDTMCSCWGDRVNPHEH